ncbi:MAG: oligopeptide transporter, OPT family, partial [Chlamydiia bacterium]|nr:oligopeptide transporter, OPT family [Chlamydiia bacterium]
MAKATQKTLSSLAEPREFTLRATLLGLFFGLFFAVANGYLALKVGTTVSASIPAAILSMGVFKLFRKKGTILESNIVQTMATVGEGLAAGITFTIPALILLGDTPSIGRIFLLSSLGGILGILLMIPMRRFLIVEEHKTLPYPEGTACAQILKAATSTTESTVLAIWGVVIGALYKIATDILSFWEEVYTWTGTLLKRNEFSIDGTPALLGVGYIVGPYVSSLIFAGSLLAWFGIIPLIQVFGLGNFSVYPSTTSVDMMPPAAIWSSYVRYIGAGTLVVGGLLSLFKVFPLLHQTMRLSVKELLTTGLKTSKSVARQDLDIPLPWLLLGSVAIVLILAFTPSMPMNLFTIVLLVVLAFFFVAVTSVTVGIVGSTSNPVSGMTIMTLLITCIAFVLLGWTERVYLISAITMGVVACCAICIAGTTAQDLKTGYLLGATPRSQQIAEIFGIFLPSLALGYVIYLLNSAYQIGSGTLPAPQASLLHMVATGVISGELPYTLVGIGVVLGIVMA